tara:strand:+ start:3772 stop:5046 length:1275 start_codon:yes stop_codon:yes gene_type:complete
MIDIELLRNDPDFCIRNLKKKGFNLDIEKFKKLDAKRKELQIKTESLQEISNKLSKEIGKEKDKTKKEKLILKGTKNSQDLKELKTNFEINNNDLDNYLSEIPNLLNSEVPLGIDENDFRLEYEKGAKKEFNFQIKDHQDLGGLYENMDFERAAKIAKSRYVVLKNDIAKLHRSLIQYMLDVHTNENGYQEINVPYIANANSLYGTGQLPKFEDDVFKIAGEDEMYLIPTAEVSVTNLFKNEIIDQKNLPLKYVCHTACFRSESGSYGVDTKGMIRLHQFEKVELVKFTHPDSSAKELESLTSDAEKILNNLELPYRKITLCSKDTGFSSSLTYDLEVWMPSQDKYREISSCSNFTDFQSRRMKTRIKQEKKNILCHTINGSGLAIGRTLAAIMENFQNNDGSINIPKVLIPYMGGLKKLNLTR